MENKSQLRQHESDNAKGSSKTNIGNSGSQSGNPQRGRTNSTKSQQSSALWGSHPASNTDADRGGPSRQTTDAQNSSGQL
ncbi:MAG: hypothetical protein ACLGSD_18700 [Acidobacteriota bacterium]